MPPKKGPNFWSIFCWSHPCPASRGSLVLEALAMDDGRSRLIILALRDPHLLEGAQRTQDRTPNPNAVLSLRWSDHLDLHGGRRQGGELLGHAFTDPLEHGGATGEDHVGIQVLADIHVTFEEMEKRHEKQQHPWGQGWTWDP